MAIKQPLVSHHNTDTNGNQDLRRGASLMAIAGLAFIGYGVVFLVRTFFGSGFEIGVATLNGVH